MSSLLWVHWIQRNSLVSMWTCLGSFQNLFQISQSSSLTCPLPLATPPLPAVSMLGVLKSISVVHLSGFGSGARDRLGRGALLAKLDIQSTYKIVLVYAEDCCLLGSEVKEQLFVDCLSIVIWPQTQLRLSKQPLDDGAPHPTIYSSRLCAMTCTPIWEATHSTASASTIVGWPEAVWCYVSSG